MNDIQQKKEQVSQPKNEKIFVLTNFGRKMLKLLIKMVLL